MLHLLGEVRLRGPNINCVCFRHRRESHPEASFVNYNLLIVLTLVQPEIRNLHRRLTVD